MRAPVADGVFPEDAPIAIALGDVDVAPYLSGSGLVLETGALQVHAARNHSWAEPLDEGLRRYLRTRLSSELTYSVAENTTGDERPEFVIDVDVDELHGTRSGTARLIARWRIHRFDGTGKPAAFRFAADQPLAQDGYAALAEAEIALVSEFAAAIAKSLRSSLPAGAEPVSGTDD